MSTGVKAHVAGSCGCKAGWFERWLSRPLIGLFPSIIYLCIGLRCRFMSRRAGKIDDAISKRGKRENI